MKRKANKGNGKYKKSKGNKRKGTLRTEVKVFYVLLLITLVLGSLNIAQALGYFLPTLTDSTVGEDQVINLEDWTLEQKIAQMVITHGGTHNKEVWQKLQLGGIHLYAMESEELYTETIQEFQEGMEIPFFVTVDLEGCWNPFANFYQTTSVSDITTKEEAYQKGVTDGDILARMGFTINFAPVIDLDDLIWNCRSFSGDKEKVSILAEAYVEGLQSQNVMATGKHYPGKTLVVRDPHQELVIAEIDSSDLYPYQYLSEKGNIGSFMVSHLIVLGELNSEGAPSVVSNEVISPLKENFNGLIITDDTMMLGLRDYYDEVDQLYVDVFKAGNDMVINFDEDPNEIYRMITVVVESVRLGEISEEQIDASVTKILIAKGFSVE